LLLAKEDHLAAIERLLVSLDVDARYPPTWALLGDVYDADGNTTRALDAYNYDSSGGLPEHAHDEERSPLSSDPP